MFKINDIVTYGTNGVCKITGTEEKDLMGTKKTYLVLKPTKTGDNSTYFVPSDNENLLGKMRKLLSEDEINNLIDSMPDKKPVWIDNERERKECYKKILSECNRQDLIGMIKAIHSERKTREKTGKKLHISDERFLKEAEKVLYEEFQYVLKIPEHEIVPYILSRIERNQTK